VKAAVARKAAELGPGEWQFVVLPAMEVGLQPGIGDRGADRA
jgi:hypothetical protein